MIARTRQHAGQRGTMVVEAAIMLPLLLLMTTSVLFGLVSVLYVIKRENEIAAI